jgi:hypothetical protein
MTKPLKTVLILCAVFGLCQIATANTYNVTLDTAPLVGHPAGPFVVFLEFTDGSGIGDANNTVTLSGLDFSGGSALGSPIVFGGASGSLENGISITDTSVISFFEEGFNPGLQLSFSLDLTLNDDSGGTPDRFTFFLLDSSQVPLPTLAPFGDYFFGADIYSTGPIFDAYGSDASRSLSVGGPASIPVPTITSVSSVPEPSTIYLLGGALAMMGVLKTFSSSSRKGKSKA